MFDLLKLFRKKKPKPTKVPQETITMRFFVENQSTLMKDPLSPGRIVRATDLQILNDAGPAWGVYGNVFLGAPTDPQDGDVHVKLLDQPDQPNALGDHYEDNGVFVAQIFLQPIYDAGGDDLTNPALSVSSVVSHEILETLVDPTASDWSQRDDSSLIASELSDPVEADSYSISIDGIDVQVSNFVLRHWFDEQNTKGPYDFLKKLSKPFSMTPGGYLIVMAAGGVTTEGERQAARAKATARGARRRSLGGKAA